VKIPGGRSAVVTCLQRQHEIIQVADEEVRMRIFALSEETGASNLCQP